MHHSLIIVISIEYYNGNSMKRILQINFSSVRGFLRKWRQVVEYQVCNLVKLTLIRILFQHILKILAKIIIFSIKWVVAIVSMFIFKLCVCLLDF
jgi:hypothetical protein